MNYPSKLFYLIFVLCCVFWSCERAEFAVESADQNPNPTYYFPDSKDMIILGKELNDPYKLSNMKAAYDSLTSKSANSTDFELKPTHLYLKFHPKNNEEWDLLKSDNTIPVYDFPLHYELLNEGATFYHDPSLPESSITYQYMVLPINKEIPNVDYKLLYEVYIPDSKSVMQKGTSFSDVFLTQLEDESMRLTGMDLFSEQPERPKKVNGKYHPRGTITVYDHILQSDIGLIGAQVHARWLTRTKTDVTDSDGDFYIDDEFRYDVNYSIKWERNDYNIRDGMLTQAWYNGPKSDDPWILSIGTGGKSIMYATINRAAYMHFYGNNQGLVRPEGLNGAKVNLCYIDEYGGYNGRFWVFGGGAFPDIKIWGLDGFYYRETNGIFATTAHELAHLCHFGVMGDVAGLQVEDIVVESWAECVEWIFTNSEYHSLGSKYNNSAASNYDDEFGGQQDWDTNRAGDPWDYSPLFVDLIDTYNQRSGYSYGLYPSSSRPDDNISGYSLDYIEAHILLDAYGRSSLRDAIKDNKVSGVTDSQIDDLFALYW